MKKDPHASAGHHEFYRNHVKPNAGRTLVVGSRVYPGRCDRRALFKSAVGVDMLDGPGVDHVINMEGRIPESLGTFDHIDCDSVVEHSRNPWKLAANIERLLNPGGTLFVSVPFVWRIHAYPDDYWRMTPEAVRLLFPKIEWVSLLLANEALSKGPVLASTKINDHAYMSRTETMGFGVKR